MALDILCRRVYSSPTDIKSIVRPRVVSNSYFTNNNSTLHSNKYCLGKIEFVVHKLWYIILENEAEI
jgi:hypothetical protein